MIDDFRPSLYLFARPSFLEGVARVLDFRGTLNEYNVVPGAEADRLAFEADAAALRRDIAVARERLAKLKADVDGEG